MKRFSKSLRNRHLWTSVQTSLRASAVIPNSGIDALATSQGASVALSEVLQDLESTLEKIDLDGDINGQLKAELGRLDAKVSSFATSSVHFCPSIEKWNFTRAHAELIGIAWDCAANVYDRQTSQLSEGYDFHLQATIPSSRNGNIKETTLTIVTQKFREGSTNLLVIAIRGSAGTIDHIVNFHGESKDANALIFEVAGAAPSAPLINAHAGFLNCALQIRRRVSDQIDEYLMKSPEKHILFTGHSAGGAVASLLALTFNSESKKRARFSCITFGSPPVAKFLRNSPPQLDPDPYGTIINIINEFDFVSRAEREYIRSLLKLHNSPDSEASVLQSAIKGKAIWPLQPPTLEHIGSIVVITKEMPDFSTGNEIGSTNPVSAWSVPREEFSSLLFCKFSVHKRACYRERISELVKGNINRMGGWDDEQRTSQQENT